MEKDFSYYYDSPLGKMIMTSDGAALTGLWFAEKSRDADKNAAALTERDLPVFRATARWLDVYFTGKDPGFTPPLLLRGTAFQKAVWEILLTIPYGQTTAYGTIAAALARERGIPRMAAQAVGGAVGRNPVSLIVPCHRVVGADGSLTGYGGGLDRKRALLALEQPPSTGERCVIR